LLSEECESEYGQARISFSLAGPKEICNYLATTTLQQARATERMQTTMKDIDDDWTSRARDKFKSLTQSEEKLCEKIFSGQRADYRVDSSSAESKRLNGPGSEADWGPDRSLRAEIVTWLCEISKSWNPVGIGVIEIRGAKIEGELRLDNASINVVLRLLQCCIKGTIYLRNATLRTIDLEGTYLFPTKVIDDDSKKRIWCIKATEAEINGSVRLKNGFSAFGMIDFDNSKINGNFQCSDGKFSNNAGPAFSAKGADIIGDLSLDDGFKPNGDIRLRRVKVGGRLTVDPAINSSNANNHYNLDLRFAQIGTLYHKWTVWPTKGHLLLNGLVYNALGRPSNDPKQIHDAGWLQMQPENWFSAQPYEQLAKVLRTSGEQPAAKRVLIAKQNDYRKRGDLGWFGKMCNAILAVAIAHGYEPHRALLWMLIVVSCGWIIFAWANANHIMSETKREEYKPDTEYPTFNTFAYSLDSFLPIVDLRQKEYWLPNAKSGADLPFAILGQQVTWGGIVRAYLWFHIILGWLLTSLWVAGFTGLVRSGASD
jgi:hypothetical protein